MTIASFQSRVRAGKLNTVQGGEHAVENFKSSLNSRSLRNICISLDNSLDSLIYHGISDNSIFSLHFCDYLVGPWPPLYNIL